MSDDLRLEFTTRALLNTDTRSMASTVHMQPFVRDSEGRWRKSGPGFVNDSIAAHLDGVKGLLENDQLDMLLNPHDHMGDAS